MSTVIEKFHAEEFLYSEANGHRSRESVTIASGTPAIEAGAVLGLVTATGAYAPYDNAAADGTETAAAILIARVDASATARQAPVIARDAEVVQSLLAFQSGQDSAAQEAAIADLTALGIIAR